MDGTNTVTVKYKKAVSSTGESGQQSVNYLETSYTFVFGNTGLGGPAKSALVYQLDENAVSEILAYADYVPAAENE